MLRTNRPPRQWKAVAARFSGQFEIAAGGFPFRPMRCDAAASGAELREQMREFVPQRFVDFRVAELLQFRIQCDQKFRVTSETGGRAHPRIPAHANLRPERVATGGTEDFARLVFNL